MTRVEKKLQKMNKLPHNSSLKSMRSNQQPNNQLYSPNTNFFHAKNLRIEHSPKSSCMDSLVNWIYRQFWRTQKKNLRTFMQFSLLPKFLIQFSYLSSKSWHFTLRWSENPRTWKWEDESKSFHLYPLKHCQGFVPIREWTHDTCLLTYSPKVCPSLGVTAISVEPQKRNSKFKSAFNESKQDSLSEPIFQVSFSISLLVLCVFFFAANI